MLHRLVADEDYVSVEVHALSALSSDDSSKSYESFLASASDRSDPFLQEPRIALVISDPLTVAAIFQ